MLKDVTILKIVILVCSCCRQRLVFYIEHALCTTAAKFQGKKVCPIDKVSLMNLGIVRILCQ